LKRKFSIKVTKRFERKLGKLLLSLQRTILEKALELGVNPYLGKRLRGELAGLFSSRVGDYRVLYWIDMNKAVVWLLEVEHRKKVYESR